MKRSVQLAVFDLGNVVFAASFDPAFEEWSRISGISATELKNRFKFDSDFEAFERGTLEPTDFHLSLCRKLGIELSYAEFLAGWNAIYGEVFHDVVSALKELKGKVTVVAFTNTNKAHSLVWPELYRDALAHFDRIFISSELGMRKPDTEGFLHVLKECNVSPDEAVFFDDYLPNIEAARALGVNAYHVENPDAVVYGLRQMNLI